MGAADHRAVPGRAPGRRARGLPARPRRSWPTSSGSTRPAAAQLEQQILEPRTRALRAAARAGGNLPSLSAELVGRDAEIAALARPARRRAAGRGRRPRRRRQDGRRDRDRPRAAACPAASGWPGSRPRTTADEVLDTVIAALNVTGGEAALLERLAARRAVVILDNCEHVVDAAAALAVRLLDAAPGAADPVHQPGLRSTSTARPCSSSRRSRSTDAVELFTRRAPPRRGRPATRGARAVPVARRAAAGDRARRGADEDAVGRGDHPPPRRPLQRAERPDQPQARAPPGAEGDDRVELRAAVPRRPARPVGAGHVRRRRAAAGGRVRARSARRARRPRRSTWSAGSRAARWSSSTTTRRRATGCSTASARSRSRRWPTPG